jgi:hypothetical protein
MTMSSNLPPLPAGMRWKYRLDSQGREIAEQVPLTDSLAVVPVRTGQISLRELAEVVQLMLDQFGITIYVEDRPCAHVSDLRALQLRGAILTPPLAACP